MKNEATKLAEKLLRLRHTGTRGTPITMHRAFRNIKLTPASLFAIIVLPPFFCFLVWNGLDAIAELWAGIFDFCIRKMQLSGNVSYADLDLFGKHLFMPFPDLQTSLPSDVDVWVNLIAALILLVLIKFIPKNFLPAAYILRVALIIQITASIFFLINPDSPPYELSNYIKGMLNLGIYLLLLLAPLLALIYYIFDFAFWRKFAVTFFIIAYFIIALPLQYMLQALIISSVSMLFMPVLYLLFGALLDTLMFVGWYSWAMTWAGREKQE